MSELKDQPIYLPDGTPVKEGMTIYLLGAKYTGGAWQVEKYDNYIYKHSGASRAKITKVKVISVNQGANTRSFVTRSDKGCEQRYTVKDNCLDSKMFGCKKKLHKAVVTQDKEDLATLREKKKELDNKSKAIEKAIKKLGRCKHVI